MGKSVKIQSSNTGRKFCKSPVHGKINLIKKKQVSSTGGNKNSKSSVQEGKRTNSKSPVQGGIRKHLQNVQYMGKVCNNSKVPSTFENS